MLEILILIGLCKRIGAIVRAKGHAAGWYQAMLVFMWFGGELGGGFLGGVMAAIVAEREEPSLGLVYLLALGGAVIGAVAAFAIARNLSSKAPEFDPRTDEYFRPSPPLKDQGGPNDGIRPSARPEEGFRS